MPNPYTELPEKAFWRTAVAGQDMRDIGGLWTPKFPIRRGHKIATFGSCFAQHFGKALRKRKFGWIDGEPAPSGLSQENGNLFGYNLFSSRTANIYTASLMVQWISWALEIAVPPKLHWEKNGRVYDPFRPAIEPEGFESIEEMEHSRQVTIEALGAVIRTADIFVFTLGLTESWFDSDGYEYPMCPGTVAGEYNGDTHRFLAQGYEFVEKNLRKVVTLLRGVNPEIRVLLTVSPVPLTATNSGKHVLVATSASKSILRAVAETVSGELNFVDYFPSFEMINSPVFKGAFFKSNLREVGQNGVDFVMDSFFDSIGFAPKEGMETIPEDEGEQDALANIACEEEVLAAFAQKSDSA